MEKSDMMNEIEEIMVQAIMEVAGLSEFDREPIEEEVQAILKALRENGYDVRRCYDRQL